MVEHQLPKQRNGPAQTARAKRLVAGRSFFDRDLFASSASKCRQREYGGQFEDTAPRVLEHRGSADVESPVPPALLPVAPAGGAGPLPSAAGGTLFFRRGPSRRGGRMPTRQAMIRQWIAGGSTPKEREERRRTAAERFPPRRFRDGAARAVLDALADRACILGPEDEAIRKALLELEPARGRVLPSKRAVAAHLSLPEAHVWSRVQVLIGFGKLQPISVREEHALWERVRRRLRKEARRRAQEGGRPFKLKTPRARKSAGWAACLRRWRENPAAGWASFVELAKSAEAFCRGCQAPLLPPRYPGDPHGLFRPGTDLCPPPNDCCRANASRQGSPENPI